MRVSARSPTSELRRRVPTLPTSTPNASRHGSRVSTAATTNKAETTCRHSLASVRTIDPTTTTTTPTRIRVSDKHERAIIRRHLLPPRATRAGNRSSSMPSHAPIDPLTFDSSPTSTSPPRTLPIVAAGWRLRRRTLLAPLHRVRRKRTTCFAIARSTARCRLTAVEVALAASPPQSSRPLRGDCSRVSLRPLALLLL